MCINDRPCCPCCDATLATDSAQITSIAHDLRDTYGASFGTSTVALLPGARGLEFGVTVITSSGAEHVVTTVATSIVVAYRYAAVQAGIFIDRGDWD